jgi:DNA helicase-4
LALRATSEGLDIVRSDDAVLKFCPSCNVGTIVARDGVNGRFYSCTKSPVCSYTEEACPTCRRGFLVERDGSFVCSNRSCDHRATVCPRCKRGWLETKINGQNGDKFLGCSRFRDEEASCTYTQDLYPRAHRPFYGRGRRWR